MNTHHTDRTGRLFDTHAARLVSYARRHGDAGEVDDLVAEAFAVAVRRPGAVPDTDAEAFVWLVATVRRLAANQRRRRRTREQHWSETVRRYWHVDAGSPEQQVAERESALSALATLSDSDRELLLLVAWEGLTPTEAGQVLGIRPNTAAARLSRARKRLSVGTADASEAPAPTLRAVPAAPFTRSTP